MMNNKMSHSDLQLGARKSQILCSNLLLHASLRNQSMDTWFGMRLEERTGLFI